MTSQLDIFPCAPNNRFGITNKVVLVDGRDFYNTTHLSGKELKAKQIRAGSETERILSFFQAPPNESFTPFDVERRLFPDAKPLHITNTRRSITTLTKMGCLEKSGRRKVEETGEWNLTWKLK